MSLADPIDVTLDVARALERAQVSYAICGSLASTIHGEPRATMDVDVVLLAMVDDVERLSKQLEEDFIVDPKALRDAVQEMAMVNVVHARAYTKVDLYFSARDSISVQEIERAVRVQLREGTHQLVRVITAEDCVLQKLCWFRSGGETSDRQWRDVLGVLRTQTGRLDEAYLDRWAPQLEVADLLSRARQSTREGS